MNYLLWPFGTAPAGRRLGWRKDKFDGRDYLHARRAAKVPDEATLVQFCPEAIDQGDNGACVGAAFDGLLCLLARQLAVYCERYSIWWIYNGARFIEGSLAEDAGAYPRDACEWLRAKGSLLSHFWPYTPDLFDPSSPPGRFDVEAAKWPLAAYYRVTGGVTGICDAIAGGNPVAIGVPWFDAWMEPGRDGALAVPSKRSQVAGGHEVLIYGYDQTIGRLKGINSWGADWGALGHFTMPFEAFDLFGRLGGYDAHYLSVAWAAEPVPEPDPPPAPAGKTTIQLRTWTGGDTPVVLYEGPIEAETTAAKRRKSRKR